MPEIVNLNRVRKQKARAGRKAEAAANRVRFGRTKAERAAARAAEDKAGRDLAGHRLGADDPDKDPGR
jgi:hypothetical protein